MSASLVGSEMCIRDRHWKSMHTLKASERRRLMMLHTGSTYTNVLQEYRPVSYTHLTLPTICSV
eukprot:11854124-Alexandrium_andersonii.AAC.1